MSRTVTVRVPFEICAQEVVAIVRAVYHPPVPATWVDPPDGNIVEDKSLLCLKLNGDPVQCPAWLKRIILDDRDTESALLVEGREPSDPPERDDRP